ncbi:MAG TPA: diguanylate cyclase [Blastocatellia bacterium]|nr:diguanylate cyclase [Blastocatellia bacterium]
MMVKTKELSLLAAPDHRRARLAQLGLAANDEAAAVVLHDTVIVPHHKAIIEAFYDYLFSSDDYRAFLHEPELIARLKQSQSTYLLGLGIGFSSLEYWQDRLRIGFTHARVGLPLSLYVCAYNQLQELILQRIPDGPRGDGISADALRTFVLKIMSLDMSLALETYHYAEVSSLEKSLDELRGEGEHLRTLASTDPLTGVANRKGILDLLSSEMADNRPGFERIVVLMIDLDHFKMVNDAHGHIVGDDVLRHVATRIQTSIRTIDAVGRYGGEEFLVVLCDTNQASAMEIAERIRRKVGDSHIAVCGLDIGVTLSVGLAEARANDTLESLISRADRALYEAKTRGRNQSVFHGGPS